jgi:hypothetical protein
MSLRCVLLPGTQRMLRSTSQGHGDYAAVLGYSPMPSVDMYVRSAVGTYSDPVARTTFRYCIRCLSLRAVMGSGMSVISCIMMRWCVWKVLFLGCYFDERYHGTSALVIDVLKSRWNVSRWPSLTCTATVLPRFQGKNSKVARGSVSVSCSHVFGRTHSVGGAWAGRGIGTQPFFLESRNETNFSWYVFGFSAALLKRAAFAAWGEPMANPRTVSR